GHSLLALRLVAEVERRFDQRLPLSLLFPAVTVEKMAAVLRQDPAGRPRSPVLVLQPAGDPAGAGGRGPFFFVHPIGGAATCYLALSRHLGPGQPFYALEDPALYDDESLDDGFEALAARYVAAVREVRPEGPCILGGWSYGGIMAFEMARQLRALGQEVPAGGLLDRASPAAIDGFLGAVAGDDR